jgi:hypothetical protein
MRLYDPKLNSNDNVWCTTTTSNIMDIHPIIFGLKHADEQSMCKEHLRSNIGIGKEKL